MCFTRVLLAGVIVVVAGCSENGSLPSSSSGAEHSRATAIESTGGKEIAASAVGDIPTDTGKKPNVVWIVLDACRARNLSCYGSGRLTSPNIDSIAERGIVFEHNFAQSPWTGRSVPSY
ncbi:MAG: sulfatase-like hydrolase/transferase, partial [Candidatus Hydrogenedentes bacterium]|nr:sulfatase-like hydrolase/transferase [Candidatus Hydrogenedentota bacterium]